VSLRSKSIWISAAGLALIGAGWAVWRGAQNLAASFEPTIRAQAIQYLEDHFHADVQLKRLDVSLPKFSPWKLWRDKGKGSMARVVGQGLILAPKGRPDLPALLAIDRFRFEIDLAILTAEQKHVPLVALQGVKINIPPKGQRSHIQMSAPAKSSAPSPMQMDASGVIIDQLDLQRSTLTILPRQADRKPLQIDIDSLQMHDAGARQAMNYVAELHIPKPNGWIRSTGNFGPWNTDEPGDTPLTGRYTFRDADLGVFKPIAGILQSEGEFQGTLDEVNAKGEARVPDFKLKGRGRAMPLVTRFEALVDGTNGNTILKPVRARLGTTSFVTSGAIIKREKERRRSIRLKVDVPKGEIGDFLKLAMANEPFMTGAVTMKFDIDVPPLDGKVVEKLMLDGTFLIDQGRFLEDKVAGKVEELSQRGQGHPGESPLGDTLSQLRGAFHLDDQKIDFRELTFSVPGAKVEMKGGYDMAADNVDFHGALKLDAKVSQTLTGWKRWAAKPIDPFFSKNGAGTYLRIQVVGTAKKPEFGLEKNKDKK
jgi:hypothetical protein